MQGNIDFTGSLSGSIAGGGGGGSDVTITPTLATGTKIADYTIDSESGSLYAPTPEGLTAELPLDISNNVISIDLSDYATVLDLDDYQEKLTAGNYVNINSNNEISCTPPITAVWYTPEPDVQQDVLIGKFTVNEVTQNVYAPAGGGGLNYSTTEQDTGVLWLDGSHIYQKTIKLEDIALAGNSFVARNISDYISNVNILIGYETIIHNKTGNTFYLMPYSLYSTLTGYSVNVAIAGNEIDISTGNLSGSMNTDIYITLKYTKSA